MKITINKTDLVKALSACSTVLQKKSVIPMIDNVLIQSVTEGDNHFLTLRTTSLASEVNYRIPLNDAVEFSCLVPCQLLFNTVRLMTDEVIQMAIKPNAENKGMMLHIKTKKGLSKIAGYDVDDFPIQKYVRPKEVISLKSSDTFNDLRKANSFIEISDLRPVLGCLSIKISGEKMTTVSMTSTVGSRMRFEINNPYDLELDFLIQKQQLQPLLAIEFGSTIYLGREGDVFTISSGNINYSCNIYAEQMYPNIEPVYKQKSESFVTVNPMELKDSLNRVLNFSDDDDFRRIKIKSVKDYEGLEISSDGYRGSSKEINEITDKNLLFTNYELSLTVAARFLQTILDSCNVPSFNFYFTNIEGVYNRGVFFDFTSTSNGVTTEKEFVLMLVAE